MSKEKGGLTGPAALQETHAAIGFTLMPCLNRRECFHSDQFCLKVGVLDSPSGGFEKKSFRGNAEESRMAK